MTKDNKPEQEIWSEYFRIKNQLMDYDENLRESIANVRAIMVLKTGTARKAVWLIKAQKHVGMILDLGLSCGAIPIDSNPKDLAFIKAVSVGYWNGIEDFERCQEFFRNSYIKTKFYNIAKEKPRMLAPHEV